MNTMTSFDRERWRGRAHIAGRVGMLLLFIAFMFGPALLWVAHNAGVAVKINGEECELVTDFATLRSGMEVILRGPGAREGRYLLLGQEPSEYQGESNMCFRAYPDKAVPPKHFVLNEEAVRRRLVYRVVDPKLAATTTRKREAVSP